MCDAPQTETEKDDAAGGRAEPLVGLAASKDEWVDRCVRRYLACGITDKNKAHLWAEACWHLLDGDLSESPEYAADQDLASW